MNEIVPFVEHSSWNFEQHTVRTVVIQGEPWFVAKDVAVILGYQNPSEAARDHCKRVEILKASNSLGLKVPPRGLQIIPEPDLYRLITRSALTSAERFEAWVYEEVLPAIRKTGSYSVAPPQFKVPRTYIEALEAHLADQKVIAAERERNAYLEQKVEKVSGELMEAKEERDELATELGLAGEYRAVKGISWFTKVFSLADTYVYNVVGKQLTELSEIYGYMKKFTDDKKWGRVGLYRRNQEQPRR